jgi:peptide chain release factor 2
VSTRFAGVFDLSHLEQQIRDLEAETSNPDLWSDQAHAHTVMQRLARLSDVAAGWKALEDQLQSVTELVSLTEANDTQLLNELGTEVEELRRLVDAREIAILLGGRYDDRPAFLQVQAGAGGVDSQDWAQMLARMYLRWAEKQGWKASIIDEMDGEEAGIKNATIELRGDFAYGYAKAEAGVHRLVRLSPFDQAHRRHTSFARVEVMPEVDDAVEVQIDPDDIRVDVYRSGGHGGQGVNTTDSAVRLTHLPTGIVVTCQNERSQLQNKETALKVLRGRLLERQLQEQREARLKLRGEYREAAWGNQIRSYVLHPYNMVKDHRTDVETGNTQAVLDGDISLFVEAYLRQGIDQGE